MSVLMTILLMLIGAAEPNQVETELRTIAFEQMVDPVDRWHLLVDAYFPEDEVDTALCIIRYESGGDPEADNPRSTAAGLFQILGSLWAPRFGVSEGDLYDPATNVRLARHIWDESGWGAWTTDRLCI